MSAPDLPLRTERLTLRPHTESDLERLFEVYGDPEVCRFLPFGPWRREDADEQLAKRMTRTDLTGEAKGVGLVVDAGDGRYLGDVVLFEYPDQPRTAEIGWCLHPDSTGHGYAAEAARALLDLAFGHYDLHRVIANLDPRNSASVRVCERVGMRREAHHLADYFAQGEWTDSYVYAVLAREWPTQH